MAWAATSLSSDCNVARNSISGETPTKSRTNPEVGSKNNTQLSRLTLPEQRVLVFVVLYGCAHASKHFGALPKVTAKVMMANTSGIAATKEKKKKRSPRIALIMKSTGPAI